MYGSVISFASAPCAKQVIGYGVTYEKIEEPSSPTTSKREETHSLSNLHIPSRIQKQQCFRTSHFKHTQEHVRRLTVCAELRNFLHVWMSIRRAPLRANTAVASSHDLCAMHAQVPTSKRRFQIGLPGTSPFLLYQEQRHAVSAEELPRACTQKENKLARSDGESQLTTIS